MQAITAAFQAHGLDVPVEVPWAFLNNKAGDIEEPLRLADKVDRIRPVSRVSELLQDLEAVKNCSPNYISQFQSSRAGGHLHKYAASEDYSKRTFRHLLYYDETGQQANFVAGRGANYPEISMPVNFAAGEKLQRHLPWFDGNLPDMPG